MTVPKEATTPDMLRLAVAAVLEADKEFRANMPPEWEGDPLSDEIDGLRRVFSSTLPIAGEGKVPEGWQLAPKVPTPEMQRVLFTLNSATPRSTEDVCNAYQAILNLAAIDVPSSPGKDGGQGPVGTGVFENGEMVGFIGLGDEFNPDPERPRDTRPIFTTPQPASTALVERLKERGQAFANQVRLITHLLHGQAYSTTVAELNAFDAALSASTSREGER